MEPVKERSCKKCHRILKNPDSIKRGYGATCWHKLYGKSAHATVNQTLDFFLKGTEKQ